MQNNEHRLVNTLLFVWMLLLPWQTIYLLGVFPLAKWSTQYGQTGVYITAVMLFIIGFIHTIQGWQLSKQSGKQLAFFFAFLVYIVVSGLFSNRPLLTIMYVYDLAPLLLLYALLLDKRIDRGLIIRGFVYGLIPAAFLGIYQFLSGSSPAFSALGLAFHHAQALGDSVVWFGGERFLRAYGSFPHPNIFGGYLVAGLFLTRYMWLQHQAERLKWGGIAIILGITLLLTFSEAAWLGLGIAAIAGVGVHEMHRRKINLQKVLPIATIIILVLACVATFALSRLNPANYGDSIGERIEYIRAWPEIVGSKWVFGHGAGSYTYAWNDLDPSREWWEYQPIHNVPMLMIAESGVIGLALLAMWLARTDRINFVALPDSFALTMLMICTAFLVIAFLDHYFWSFWPGLAIMVVMLGLTVKTK